MIKNHYSKELHSAVSEKNADKIKYCLDKGADINSINRLGQTVLHLAVSQNNLNVIKFLLNRKADINSVTVGKATVLHSAVKNKSKYETKIFGKNHKKFIEYNNDIIKFPLKQPLNINAKNNVGENALHIAAKYGNRNLVELLIKNKVNVNETTCNGETVLHYVTKYFRKNNISISIAKLLLKSGVQIDAKNKKGETALYLAVKLNNFKLTKYLITMKANVNSETNKCQLPIFTAVRNSNIKMINLLLKNDAKINFKNAVQENLLHVAFKYTSIGEIRLKIMKLLLKSGININEQTFDKSTALHLALKDKDEDLVKVLIEYGSFVNIRNGNDEPPLYIAVSFGLTKSIKLLILKGANVNDIKQVYSQHAESILDRAIMNGDESSVKLLIQYNANINSYVQTERTPLNKSIIYGYNSITMYLLEKGASVNLKDCFGDAPLHLAIKFQLLGCKYALLIQHLLELGADVNQENAEGQTPLMLIQSDPDSELRISLLASLMLIKHIALLIDKKYYLSFSNLIVILKEKLFTNYLLKCLNEILLMRSDTIVNGITYHDLLVKRHNDLVKCVQNENVVAILKSRNYELKYPRFSKQINKNFLLGLERLDLIEQSRFSLIAIVSFELPLEIATIICEILSNADLKNLGVLYVEITAKRKYDQPFTMTLRKRKTN